MTLVFIMQARGKHSEVYKDSNKLICEECGLKIQKEVLLETK